MEILKERWTKEIQVENIFNDDGNPTGGYVKGVGIDIKWQDGPLGWDYEANDYPEGEYPNGAFTEDIVLALIQRLEFFQNACEGKFRCKENAMAITKLEEVLMWFQKRHDNRVKRKVQGEHKA